ncbi:MAG: nucleoside-diphosphate kinase [Planctomycetaceae bacterium]|jgi:nucleoside-diphosphate kinase|nr:nucleoside-diphosphate kinase [Planctomycetaceae bacterium]
MVKGNLQMEQTLVLLKPDAVERRLCGEILGRFERKGLKIIRMRMLDLTPELARVHYADHVGKPFYPDLELYITSGSVVAVILEGDEAVAVVRKMIGVTNGIEAESGTIRGDLSMSKRQNLVHASDSTESAKREIKNFFPEN